MKRYGYMIFTIAFVFGLWIFTGTSAAADTPTEHLRLSVAPERVSTSVGTPVDLTITLVNGSPEQVRKLALHLDITDPRATNSVDPEDWTPTLTRTTAPVEPGGEVTESWSIAPIQGGDFVLYAVALDLDAGGEPTMLTVSNGVPVHVDEKRSFNPRGVLPLSVAMPVLVGMALIWRYRRLRWG